MDKVKTYSETTQILNLIEKVDTLQDAVESIQKTLHDVYNQLSDMYSQKREAIDETDNERIIKEY